MKLAAPATVEHLELSREFSDFSSFSSNISDELQRLASVLDVRTPRIDEPDICYPEFWCDSSLTSMLALDSATTVAVESVVRSYVESLESAFVPVEAKHVAVAWIRLLAKHIHDFYEMIEENRTNIGACGAIPLLVSLLVHGTTRGKNDALMML